MNYITRLEIENGIMKAGLKRIADYANSSKFGYPDNHMNVEDLRLRLREINGELDDADQAGRFCPNYDCAKHAKETAFHVCGKCGTGTEWLRDAIADPESGFSA